MSVVWFFVVAAAAGALTLATRHWSRASSIIGLLGLVLTAILAGTINSGDAIAIGGSTVTGSAYTRLFLTLGSVAGLILAFSPGSLRAASNLSAVALGTLALSSIVLTIGDPIEAAVAATVGGILGVGVTLGAPTTLSIGVAARELRALVIAGVLAVGAIAWAGRIPDTPGTDAGLVGIAYLASVVAVAIRLGAIPFHLWAARVADAASEAALPLLMAWGPVTLAIVVLAWIDRSIPVVPTALGAERAVIVAVAALTVVLGSIAATAHDDLEHVVGYSIIADAGFIVLALASLDPGVGGPARAYVLIYALVKSAFAAWAAVVRSTFGTRRLPELGGWARRSPLLALALVVVLVAAIGLPGVVAWDSRASVASTVLGSPLAILFVIAGLMPAAYLGRLLLVGYERTTPTVAAGPDPWPRLPEGGRPSKPRAALAWLTRVWDLNRAPASAFWALLIAGIALGVAAGALGVREAAAATESVAVIAR